MLDRKVRSGRSSEDRTDVAIFWNKEFFDAAEVNITAGKAGDDIKDLVHEHARVILPQLKNTDLSDIIGRGAWRDIYRDPTGQIDCTGLEGTGGTGHTLVGKTFTGTMATIWSGAVVPRTGDWIVDKEETMDIYECTCTITSPPSDPALTYTARVSGATLKAAIAAASDATLTDVQVSVEDFAHVKGVLAMKVASGTISARALLDAAVAAGEPLPAAVLLADAADSLLRRHAGALLDKFESWAEHSVSNGGSVNTGLTAVTEAHAELKRLRVACRPAVTSTRVPAVTTGGGVPVGTTTSAGGVTPAAPRAPFADYARYTALRGRAVDDAAFNQLKTDMMVFIEPNEAARAVRASHGESCASAIEGWLKQFKDATEPAVLGGLPPNQTTGELLAFVLSIRDNAAAATARAVESPARAAPIRVTMRSGTGTEVHGKSEVQRREETRVQSDVIELEADDGALKRLHALRVLADADDAESRSAFEDAIEKEKKKCGALHRLLTTGAEIGCITLDCCPSTVDAIMATRGVLDASLERAVFGASASLQSDIVHKALRPIRLQRISRCRPLNLLDKVDCGTEDSPLAGFAKLGRVEGQQMFFSAMHILQAAWTFAAPTHTGAVIQYMTQFMTKCREAFDAGVGWDEIGAFYRSNFRRADKAVIGFAAKQAFAEPPEAKWAKEPVFEWVAILNAQIAQAKAQTAMRIETEAQIKAVRQEMSDLRLNSKRTAASITPGATGQPTPLLSKRQRRAEAQKAKVAGLQGAAATQKAQAAATQKAAAAQTGAALTAAAGTSAIVPAGAGAGAGKVGKGGTLKADQAALTQEMGNKDGKPPCWFFHRGPTGCFKSAEECKGYH